MADLSVPPAASAPPDASSPRRGFGPYELAQELGRGAVGVVFKAWRPDLKAWFAVKVLRAGGNASAELLERFQREAQACARLRHPGIVGVHDIGTDAGRPYYAMEYIEGIGLDRVLDDPPLGGFREPTDRRAAPPRRGLALPDAVRLACELADAIDYAHRQGVVHRDLKPANVVIDRDGHARILDFGLAKLVAIGVAEGGAGDETAVQTRSGVVLGTLAYMPPEQAEGDVRGVDGRADVYSLGVMLYELVTGRLPLRAQSDAELLMKVLWVEPPRPRQANPDLPLDLETIVRKAMDKGRDRRYPNAAALAADLRAFAARRPIAARPPSVSYRIERWVRRRRWFVAGAAALLLLAGAAGASAWREGAARADKARLRARVLDDLRAKAGRYVDATLTLRRSGLAMDKALDEYLPPLERAVAEAERELPDAPEPDYHLGRMERALLRFEDARRRQDRALAKRSDYAPSLYERAILTARAYGDGMERLRQRALARAGSRLAEAGRLAAGGSGAVPVDLPADADLERTDAAVSELGRRLRADLARLESLASARGAAAAAGTAAPPAPPAVVAELTPARLACARGLALAYGPDRDRAADRARASLREAIRLEPTLEEAYEGWAGLEIATWHWLDAIEVFGQGLAADPGYVPLWVGRGNARLRWGAGEMAKGADPEPFYNDADADLSKALELAPASAGVWARRGLARMNLGLYRLFRGADPEPLFQQALTDFGKALELDPRLADAWSDRGLLGSNWGAWAGPRGRDAGALFDRALADFGSALKLEPAWAETWNRRGGLRCNLALDRLGHGADAEALFADSVADLGHALELDPTHVEAWGRRGMARQNWGYGRMNCGRNPVPLFTDAAADYGHVLELYPRDADTWSHRASLLLNWGIYESSRARDPRRLLADAAVDCRRALELNPRSAESWRRLGLICSNWGADLDERGESPEERYRDAIAAYGQALDLSARDPESWLGRGLVRMNLGLYLGGHGQDPASVYGEAEADYRQALALNPAWADAWANRGRLRAEWAGWLAGHGGDPEDKCRDGQADLRRALELNPKDAQNWQIRGILCAGWADFKRTHGQDAASLIEAALRCFTSSIAANPAGAEAHWRRGQILHVLGRWREAVADFEAAARIAPAAEPAFRRWLEDARAHLEGKGE